MISSPPEGLGPAVVVGIAASLLLLFVFSGNRAGIRPGFRILPDSAREWSVYVFHTLECLTLIGLWFCTFGGGRFASVAVPFTLASYGLLLIGSLVILRWDCQLGRRQLAVCTGLLLLVFLFYPATKVHGEVN